jgi:hypothetical protein
MIISPTFGFKGIILPLLDCSDKLYLFVKNNLDRRVLLNFVSININTFIDLHSNTSTVVSCGNFSDGIQVKGFYMGHELFDFTCTSDNKNILKYYSNYITENTDGVNNENLFVSYDNGIHVISNNITPQQLFIKIVNEKTNEILLENSFLSGGTYVFNTSLCSEYNISILNNNGSIIYKKVLTI